jgi:hypothetical protein
LKDAQSHHVEIAINRERPHLHGLNMSDRWTGLGYDGRIMTGWASMGQIQEEAEQAMARLVSSEGVPYVDE